MAIPSLIKLNYVRSTQSPQTFNVVKSTHFSKSSGRHGVISRLQSSLTIDDGCDVKKANKSYFRAARGQKNTWGTGFATTAIDRGFVGHSRSDDWDRGWSKRDTSAKRNGGAARIKRILDDLSHSVVIDLCHANFQFSDLWLSTTDRRQQSRGRIRRDRRRWSQTFSHTILLV